MARRKKLPAQFQLPQDPRNTAGQSWLCRAAWKQVLTNKTQYWSTAAQERNQLSWPSVGHFSHQGLGPGMKCLQLLALCSLCVGTVLVIKQQKSLLVHLQLQGHEVAGALDRGRGG